jgi:hypothetical protein
VLRGDMSLVGPRPHAVGMKAAERDLQHIVAEYAHRHRVKPGLTGWAQVNGSRGPIETPAEVRRRLKLGSRIRVERLALAGPANPGAHRANHTRRHQGHAVSTRRLLTFAPLQIIQALIGLDRSPFSRA